MGNCAGIIKLLRMQYANSMKKFISHMVSALAMLSSLATLITFAFGWHVDDSTPIHVPIVAGLFILGASVGYALFQVHAKKIIELDIAAKLKLTIQQADLFQQNGIIVIGFNEYFDTHLGDGIVSPKTLHGIFINKYYKDHLSDLDNDIQESLMQQGIKPIASRCTRRHPAGKTDKYKLGTCALVHDGGKKYVLVALTHFDGFDKANLSREEFNEVIGNLFEFVSNIAEDKPIHMPILGTGLSRLNRSDNRLLNYIIDCLDFQYAKPLLGGLFIDVLSLKTAGINLNSIEEHFKTSIKDEA